MKALTVRQPWAWLIFHGKPIENRNWPTSFRGLVAIHAAVGMTKMEYLETKWFALKQGVTIPPLSELTRGAVIGTATVTNCVRDHSSPYFFGKYGFVLTNQRLFAEPIPAKGALGFWEWTPPADLESLYEEPR